MRADTEASRAGQMEEAQGKAGPKKSTIVVRAMRNVIMFPADRFLRFSIIAERAWTMISIFELISLPCDNKIINGAFVFVYINLELDPRY